MVSDEAYAALLAHKTEEESFSDVIKRLAPPSIKTFGDLERRLENVQGPLFPDRAALRRIRAKKRRSNAH